MKNKLLYLPTLLSLQIKNPGGDYESVAAPQEIPLGGLTDKGTTTAQKIVQNGITIVIIIAILLCFFYLLWGGVQWITSGGDKGKIQAARSKIIYAIIGLIVVLLSYTIVIFIGRLFGLDIFCRSLSCAVGIT